MSSFFYFYGQKCEFTCQLQCVLDSNTSPGNIINDHASWLTGAAILKFLWSRWCKILLSVSVQPSADGSDRIFFFFFTFAWQLPKFGFDVAAKRIVLHWSGFSPPVPTMSWQFWAEHLAKQSAMPLFCHTVNNQAPDAKRPKLRVFFYPVSCCFD